MSYDLAKIFPDFVAGDKREWEYPYNLPKKEWARRHPQEFKKELKRIREIADSDFFFFADVIMRGDRLPRLHIGLHDQLCYILQNVNDSLNLLPRGHLKSTLGAEAYPLWLLCKNPNIRITLFSHNTDEAVKFLRVIKNNILYNKKLRLIYPNIRPLQGKNSRLYEKWSDTEIIVDRTDYFLKESSVSVGSIGQPFTGDHTDVIIFDDIVTNKNSSTADKMVSLKGWYNDVLHLLDWDHQTVHNGTRYRDGDLYGGMIDTGSVFVYLRKHIEDGKYIWDHPKNIANMEKKKKTLTPYEIACQYDNDPIVKGNQEFEPEWICRWNPETIRENNWISNPPENDVQLLEKWYSKLDLYMGVDPARSIKKNSDYTVIMVAGVDTRGRMFALDFVRKHLKSHEIVDEFVAMFTKWKRIINAKIETYGGDIYIYQDIIKEMKERGLPYYKVKEYRKGAMRTGVSEDRIRGMQTPIHNGMIWIGSGGEWGEVEQELLRFPYGKHDDLVMTMAYIWEQQIKPKPKSSSSKIPQEEYINDYGESMECQSWLLV